MIRRKKRRRIGEKRKKERTLIDKKTFNIVILTSILDKIDVKKRVVA